MKTNTQERNALELESFYVTSQDVQEIAGWDGEGKKLAGGGL